MTKLEHHALDPDLLLSYLEHAGWHRHREVDGQMSVWTTAGADQQILVPLNTEFSDFDFRLEEAVDLLALLEKRPAQEVVAEVHDKAADIYHFRRDTSFPDASIGLMEGISLIQNARNAVEDRARKTLSTVRDRLSSKREKKNSKPSVTVPDYLSRVRLAQSTVGSYVLNLVSPFRIGEAQQPQLVREQGDFSREVSVALVRGLMTVRDAADEAMRTRDAIAFRDTLTEGVTPQLCEAVVGMIGSQGRDRELDVSVSWSRVAPKAHDVADRVTFTSEHVPMLLRGARVLRSAHADTALINTDEDEVIGRIVSLRKDRTTDEPGSIRVRAAVRGRREATVIIALPEPEYIEAIRAYDAGAIIRCKGSIERAGRMFRLLDPHAFEVVSMPLWEG